MAYQQVNPLKLPILAHSKSTKIKFRSEIHPQTFPFKFPLNGPILSIGSCFSEHIGHFLEAISCDIQVNPSGILFNPLSMAKALQDILKNNRTNEADLVQQDGLWHSWKHHGRFSKQDQADALKSMNRALSKAYEKIESTQLLILTFGSAYAYKHHSYGIVANCHKVPQSQFSKVLIQQQEIISPFLELLRAFKDRSPGLEVILTLSPVRHWKDGPENNSLSKSILRAAIHEIQKSLDFCHYFPSYELLLDDLRDYRWFNSDMLHPNAQAIQYIWEKFKACLFNEEQLKYISEKEKLNQFKNHRPIQGKEHLLEYEQRVAKLKEKYIALFRI